MSGSYEDIYVLTGLQGEAIEYVWVNSDGHRPEELILQTGDGRKLSISPDGPYLRIGQERAGNTGATNPSGSRSTGES